ncbi:hypothetical protein PoB_002928900 [Plakobranchus ocellatus]|uniref:Uncharacterized protein n=1 Tax=Plakobranchus ocellatus TaxID=259542 RepID=A0AAV4A8K1_9GAST|nr:hypothetical protein PoB_002928900 [Plakobranchus ocellatus]
MNKNRYPLPVPELESTKRGLTDTRPGLQAVAMTSGEANEDVIFMSSSTEEMGTIFPPTSSVVKYSETVIAAFEGDHKKDEQKETFISTSCKLLSPGDGAINPSSGADLRHHVTGPFTNHPPS